MLRIQIFILIIFITLFSSCEETISLDLETSKERLVIEALIRWEKGTLGNNQLIKLSKTSSFYNNQIIPASGATINVTHENGTVFNFIETSDGIYKTDTFLPELNANYTLEVIYGEETYVATETLISTPVIKEVTQSIEEGFNTEDAEVNIFFDDLKDIDNYYQIVYRKTRDQDTDVEVTLYDDQFEDGNELTDFYEEEDDDDVEFLAGDKFAISLLGISRQYYNFLTLIEQQADAETGPFSIPPANVKGNCINTTNTENYPYGYFSLNEVDVALYVFK